MLEILQHIEDRVLGYIDLADTEYTPWRGLDITYEKPHVERLWMPYKEYRISLHRIHLCAADEVLRHPHPWPSAMLIVDGEYEMGIAYGEGTTMPPIAATVILGPGSRYAMVDSRSWHYVRPLNKPVISLMVSGQPWKNAPRTTPTPPKQLPLTWQAEQNLFKDFYDKFEALKKR